MKINRRFKTAFFVFMALGLLNVSQAEMTAYKLDPAHSMMGFRVSHLGVSSVKGQFNKFTGTGEFNPETGKLENVTVNIDPASIDTNEADRDKHLRGSDFFDVEKYKEIKFVSTKVDTKSDRPTKIHGKFTMHGVTRDLTLNVDDWGGVVEDPWGNQVMAFSATGALDRTKYGVDWNKPLNKAKGMLVGNEVTLLIDVQAKKQGKSKKN
jgi:polyisoprenoid-binding protein YceI